MVHLIIAISVDPDEMQHFIWVFTVCQSDCLGVSSLQRVNSFVCFVALRPKSTAKVMAGWSKG